MADEDRQPTDPSPGAAGTLSTPTSAEDPATQLRLLTKYTLMEVIREIPGLSAAAHTDAATPSSKFSQTLGLTPSRAGVP